MDFSTIQEYLTWENIGPAVSNFALAVVTLVIGLWIVKRLVRLLRKTIEKSSISEDVIPFLVSIVDIGLKVLLLFSIAEIVGIETTSFIAILGAAAFAIGLALQGSLGNFAAGVIILLFRPYRIGDWIEMDGNFGKVEEIQIFHTFIITPGQKTLIIPNGEIISNVVTNYSTKGMVRIELEVAMSYAESFPKVEKIIQQVLKETPKVLQSPNPEIGILQYDTHYIVLGVRPFIRPDDFWEVKFDVNRRIKNAFHEHNVKMAYSEGVELGDIGA